MSTALILVDIQNDYFPGGSMALHEMEPAADNAARLLAAFRDRGAPRYHVQHLSVRPGATFFVPGTPGVEINERVIPADGEPVVQKNFPNAFRDTTLLETLRSDGIQDLVIVGAMSHMCIDGAVRAAKDFGFAVTVIHDACATRDLEFGETVVPAAQVHAAFMSALGFAYAKVISAEEHLSGLAEAA